MRGRRGQSGPIWSIGEIVMFVILLVIIIGGIAYLIAPSFLGSIARVTGLDRLFGG